jgi:hypothetical protein
MALKIRPRNQRNHPQHRRPEGRQPHLLTSRRGCLHPIRHQSQRVNPPPSPHHIPRQPQPPFLPVVLHHTQLDNHHPCLRSSRLANHPATHLHSLLYNRRVVHPKHLHRDPQPCLLTPQVDRPANPHLSPLVNPHQFLRRNPQQRLQVQLQENQLHCQTPQLRLRRSHPQGHQQGRLPPALQSPAAQTQSEPSPCH